MEHVIRTAVQENDFDAWLAAWDYFIPLYFTFNNVETLKSNEGKYPGLKEMLKNTGLSVQGQDK